MAWFRTGTITVTNGSTTVSGSGTTWIANAAVGEALYAPDGRLYEIANISSDTSLTLGSAYLGSTQSGQAYVIVPSQSYIRDLAAQAADLVNNYSTIANNAGVGKFGDGTLAAPGIRFSDDLDTGFYRSASNEVTFVAGGVAQFKYNASGLQFTSGAINGTVIGGTAAAAGTFTNLAYTGTLTGGTGVINIGSGQVYKDASGNVGIGTDAPSAKLDVQGSINLKSGYNLQWGGNANNAIASSSNTLLFYTNGSERARIDSSGSLLVGTTDTSGSAGNGVKIYSPSVSDAGVSIVAAASTNSSVAYRLYSTGAGAFRFYVGYGGTISATSTSINGLSDISLKENIRDLETGLNEVMALRPRRFDWKDDAQINEKNVAGFIAQELETVLPELVYEYKYSKDETKKSIKMGDILPTLVKAIQEQQAMIQTLQAEVADLKSKVNV